MRVKVLNGIAGSDAVHQPGDIIDLPEKMARAYAAEGTVEILEETEVKAEPGTRRVRKAK
jgi:hypothetical protein